jgi:uncharacterized protein (TIGR02145 family)
LKAHNGIWGAGSGSDDFGFRVLPAGTYVNGKYSDLDASSVFFSVFDQNMQGQVRVRTFTSSLANLDSSPLVIWNYLTWATSVRCLAN